MRKLKKQAAQQVTNVKAQLKVYLKKHPLAAKYAKEPYLTWVLYGITAVTVTSTWALGAAVLGVLSLPISSEAHLSPQLTQSPYDLTCRQLCLKSGPVDAHYRTSVSSKNAASVLAVQVDDAKGTTHCRSVGREEGEAEAAKEAGSCQLKQQRHIRRCGRQVWEGKGQGETDYNGGGFYQDP